jgi:hypothetical protein
MATKTPALKIPKSLAAAADLYYSKREERLALERQAAAIQAEETLLKNHLIDNIPKSDATGIAGKLVRVSVTSKVVPQVKDWDKFYEYVAKNRSKGGFALMNKTVNSKAVAEIWAANKTVPGVEGFNALGLSVNKL